MRFRIITVVATSSVLLGCVSSKEPSSKTTTESAHSVGPLSTSTNLLRCGGAVLRYGTVSKSSETGDVSGIEISLQENQGRWSASARVARGELGGATPLLNTMVDTTAGTLAFALPQRSDTSRFDGHVSCDSIWGRWSPYPGIIDSAKVFPRMRP